EDAEDPDDRRRRQHEQVAGQPLPPPGGGHARPADAPDGRLHALAGSRAAGAAETKVAGARHGIVSGRPRPRLGWVEAPPHHSRARRQPRRARGRPLPCGVASARFVADVVTGLEDLAAEELRRLGAAPVAPGRGEVRFDHGQVGAVLRRSRLASAVYRALFFDVPRPKALLGDAAHRRLAAAAREVAAAGGMRSFRLAAAGADAPVFLRLADSLTAATGPVHDPDEGELLARFRRAGAGWEVLLRLTPRPLSTRAWRVCNLP